MTLSRNYRRGVLISSVKTDKKRCWSQKYHKDSIERLRSTLGAQPFLREFYAVRKDFTMKNVVLIGDSIRIGYDKSVRASLDGIANVYFPGDNCRFAAFVLRYLHEYLELPEQGGVDVIHWNAGLWDCLRQFGEEPLTPLEVYANYIERICIRIRKLYPEAKVIFATSTSVLSEKMPPNFKRYNEEIALYNQKAVEVVKKYGFDVNDLYARSTALPEEAHSDSVHYYTSLGTEAFTKQTLSYIASALELESMPQYVEELHKVDRISPNLIGI